MLADLFQDVITSRNQANAATNEARAQRDAFIQLEFPVLDAAFAALVDTAVGVGPLLAVTHTAATDVVSNRTFVSLNKTITQVQSTLYGPAETVQFTPGLSFVYPNQFGVIAVTKDGGPDMSGDPRVADVLNIGLVMSGTTKAAIVAPQGVNFTPVTAAFLQNLLAAMLIRTG
jgi:hypothetical protein